MASLESLPLQKSFTNGKTPVKPKKLDRELVKLQSMVLQGVATPLKPVVKSKTVQNLEPSNKLNKEVSEDSDTEEVETPSRFLRELKKLDA